MSTKLVEIFNILIKKENDAVVFYRNLMKIKEFSKYIEQLKDYEQIEIEHANVLMEYKSRYLNDLSKESIPHIELPFKPTKNEDFCDEVDTNFRSLLESIVERERNAYSFYMSLVDAFSKDSRLQKYLYLKPVFKKLADEEVDHANYFQNILNGLNH